MKTGAGYARCEFESHGFRLMFDSVLWSSGDDSWLTPRQRWFESIRDQSSTGAIDASLRRLGIGEP